MLLTSEPFLLHLKMQIWPRKRVLLFWNPGKFVKFLYEKVLFTSQTLALPQHVQGFSTASLEKLRLLINSFPAKSNNLLLLLIIKRAGMYFNRTLYLSFWNSLEITVPSPQLCFQGNRGDTVGTSFLTTSLFTQCMWVC